jgi:5-formyltetrahydrofolate cyclo-ligase
MTLKMMDLPILTAGVAYTELEVEDFPAQYHDQRLQYFVTGKEVMACT